MPNLPAMDAPSVMYAQLLDAIVLQQSDDEVKTDLEMVCSRCGEHLCDAEDGDTMRVLLNTALQHVCGE